MPRPDPGRVSPSRLTRTVQNCRSARGTRARYRAQCRDAATARHGGWRRNPWRGSRSPDAWTDRHSPVCRECDLRDPPFSEAIGSRRGESPRGRAVTVRYRAPNCRSVLASRRAIGQYGRVSGDAGPSTTNVGPPSVNRGSLGRLTRRPLVTGALIGVVLLAIVAVAAWRVLSNSDAKLAADDVATIDRADCGRLLDLHFGYSSNADSVPSARTGLNRVDQRRRALACAPIAIDDMTWYTVQQSDCGGLDRLLARYKGVSAQFAEQTLKLVALAKADRC